jgi:hypothetical protein
MPSGSMRPHRSGCLCTAVMMRTCIGLPITTFFTCGAITDRNGRRVAPGLNDHDVVSQKAIRHSPKAYANMSNKNRNRSRNLHGFSADC